MTPEARYITHEDGKWIVHAEDGKVLGEHDTEAGAKAQLEAVEAHKHDGDRAAPVGAVERRAIAAEVRMIEREGRPVVRGYGLVYGTPSVVMRDDKGRQFREIVKPGCAARSLKAADMVVNAHHDDTKILGRRSAGTARFGEDKTGLWYEADLPETSYARDLAVSLARNDIKGSSFVFATIDDDWSEPDKEGVYTRELRGVHVFDMGPVVNPAYTSTTAALAGRSLDRYLESRAAAETPPEPPPPPPGPPPELIALSLSLYLSELG